MNILLSAQAAQQGGGGFSLLIMMVLILVVMWLFMIRPQQKRQKQIRNFQNALKEGDAVVTGGGIYGTVKPAVWRSPSTRASSMPAPRRCSSSNKEWTASSAFGKW